MAEGDRGVMVVAQSTSTGESLVLDMDEKIEDDLVRIEMPIANTNRSENIHWDYKASLLKGGFPFWLGRFERSLTQCKKANFP